MRTRKLSAKTIAACGLLAALALIFSYLETLVPFFAALPGVKLGIANLAVLIVMYRYGLPCAFFVNLIRILAAGLLFSGMFGFLYSLAGGLLSLFVMFALKKTGIFSPVGVSLAGGVCHNLGQLVVAALLVSNFKMFYYFPILLFAGITSGLVIGIIGSLVLKRLNKILY